MWYSFHKSTTHSDETCRRQQQQMENNGRENYANQESAYPAVLTASDPHPGSNIEEQGILFTAVEVLAMGEPPKEQSSWPFGPTGEAVASFDTSALFSGFEGASNENIGSSTCDIKEGPIQVLGLWNHITEGLQLSRVCLEPFLTSLARRPSTLERRHRRLEPTSLVP